MNTDQLLELSSERSGLTDFGELPFREGIDVLLWSLQNESGNPPERVAQVAENLVVPALVKRLRLVEDRKRYPQIAAQEVRAPIVITGLPRTGSTLAAQYLNSGIFPNGSSAGLVSRLAAAST